MKKSLALTFVFALILASVAFAQTTQPWPAFSDNIYSYSGAGANERRLTIAPFTRELYFGYGYTAPFTNFGSKGPTYRMTNTGAKSGYSAAFNLDTNDYSNRGRDPSKISNWDPGVLGYARVDRAVDLYAYNPTGIALGNKDTIAKGTARITSFGNQFGGGGNNPFPTSQILVQTRNMPPIGENEIYEVWLMDAETERSITLGLIKNGLDPTSQLVTVIPRLVNPFEYVLVTREPFPDQNPGPSEIVLMGEINPSRVDVRPTTAGLEPVR